MSKERLYGWNGEMPDKPVSGQKQIVLAGMRARKGEMMTGKAWTDVIGKEIATKQDPYRVVLYYILILKGQGCVATQEQDILAVTRNGDVKHGILVKTDASVTERHVVVDEPVSDAEVDADQVEVDTDTLGAS